MNPFSWFRGGGRLQLDLHVGDTLSRATQRSLLRTGRSAAQDASSAHARSAAREAAVDDGPELDCAEDSQTHARMRAKEGGAD